MNAVTKEPAEPVMALGDRSLFHARCVTGFRPRRCSSVARRLLTACQAAEALQTIENAEHKRSGWPNFEPDFELEDARIDLLDALERPDEAQAARWSCFERFLPLRSE